jgi:cell division protein FtsL
VKGGLIVLFLTALIFCSAIELILTRHKSRALFVELQNLQQHQYTLQQKHRQLILEQATWSTYPRVENVARQSLDMVPQRYEDIFTLR